MTTQTIEFQAKIYVFDLQNCAREFGFKANEQWVIKAVSRAEKDALEWQYFPVISTNILPEMIAEMLECVRSKLSLQMAEVEKKLTIAAVRKWQLQYLSAYNPARLRR